MMVNDPDAAPHCTSCGYNLHGLPRLRCPECGKEIETYWELEQARWLASRNAPDRQTVLAERFAGALGAVLLIAGVSLCITHLRNVRSFGGFAFFRAVGVGLVLTLACLYWKTAIKKPLFPTLLILGSIWFVIGFCLWYAT